MVSAMVQDSDDSDQDAFTYEYHLNREDPGPPPAANAGGAVQWSQTQRWSGSAFITWSVGVYGIHGVGDFIDRMINAGGHAMQTLYSLNRYLLLNFNEETLALQGIPPRQWYRYITIAKKALLTWVATMQDRVARLEIFPMNRGIAELVCHCRACLNMLSPFQHCPACRSSKATIASRCTEAGDIPSEQFVEATSRSGIT